MEYKISVREKNLPSTSISNDLSYKIRESLSSVPGIESTEIIHGGRDNSIVGYIFKGNFSPLAIYEAFSRYCEVIEE